MTASYDYHIGVDYHKSYSHLVVQDSSGKTLRSGRVKNDRQSLGGFLERYRENSHAVVEATRNWMVMYDWLDDICDDVVLAHPLKVKAIADAKIKTDKIDATVLAHLLRADLVPEAWAPSDKARELRVALRERMFYVRLRTMTKNRIVTVFDRYPEQTAQLKKLGDLFGKAGRVQLAQVNVSELDRIQIDRGLDFIGDIDARIKQSETTIRAMTKANGNVKLLKTIPGIGEFFARLIDAEIDDVSRFRNAKKLAAYAGLVPSTYSSGGKTFHGKIIKQGNKWLRWAFVEAVAPAIASDAQLRAQYEHLKFRGVNKARVAIARKLLRSPSRSCVTSALMSRAAKATWRARRRYPGCPDDVLASSVELGCALQGEWETGSQTPFCDRSHRHQGHVLEHGSTPKDGNTCPSEAKGLADRL